jgi:phosphatidate cytidylyltransferase
MAVEVSPELQKRVITGVFGAAALIALIVFGGTIGMAFVAAILALGMVYEFVEITYILPDKPEKRIMLLGVTWLVAFINFWVPRAEYELLLGAFLALFGYFLFTADRHPGPELGQHFKELMYAIFGVLYLAFIPLFFVLLREGPNGLDWTILFFLIVWAGDTGAYFTGKKLGRRKLYEAISPKKTIEGGIGGWASGVAIAIIYKLLIFHALSWGAAVVIPIVVGPVAQVGDLCESFLKRAFDKKDSGSILPGHGGFLDRFDGVVFSLPIMYGCTRLFM